MTDKEFTIKWGIPFDCFELDPVERKQQQWFDPVFGITSTTIQELTGKVHSRMSYQPADFWTEYTRCNKKEDRLFNCNVLIDKNCVIKIYNGYFTSVDIFPFDNTMNLSFTCEHYETIFY